MPHSVTLDNIAIVLVEPQIPENIGSAARAMNNMGIRKLILVNPENYDPCSIPKTATGSSAHIIEGMEVCHNLLEALGPFHYVIGTTARIGANRPALTTPRSLAQDLISLSYHNKVAILFVPEVKADLMPATPRGIFMKFVEIAEENNPSNFFDNPDHDRTKLF